jgi:hypothetical protein
MKTLLRAIGRLSPGKKAAVVAMLVLVLVTWLAVCLVVVGLPAL